MQETSYVRRRFPHEIIQHAVWLYFRFSFSCRDVEDLLAERDIDVSYETVRRWALKFGPACAQKLRKTRSGPAIRRHLDEVSVSINGKLMNLWRAVDFEPLLSNGSSRRHCSEHSTLRQVFGVRSGHPSMTMFFSHLITKCWKTSKPVKNKQLEFGDMNGRMIVKQVK